MNIHDFFFVPHITSTLKENLGHCEKKKNFRNNFENDLKSLCCSDDLDLKTSKYGYFDFKITKIRWFYPTQGVENWKW